MFLAVLIFFHCPYNRVAKVSIPDEAISKLTSYVFSIKHEIPNI